MNPIKLCLNLVAAIILTPLMPIVALAWLAAWLTADPQTASGQNAPSQKDVGIGAFAIESKPVQADSVFGFSV